LDAGVEVAFPAAAKVGHALPGQPEDATVLRLRRHAERAPPAQRLHLHLAAERGVPDEDRHVGVEVVALALEARVRQQLDFEVQVAARSAVHTGVALAGHLQSPAILDAGRDLYLDALALHLPVFIGHVDDELAHAAAIRLLERDLDFLLQIVPHAGARARRPRAGTDAAAEEAVEEVAQVAAHGGFE